MTLVAIAKFLFVPLSDVSNHLHTFDPVSIVGFVHFGFDK